MEQLLKAADGVASQLNCNAQILGNNLVSPEMVATVIGLKYTDEQLIRLAQTSPDSEEISRFVTEGFVLVPLPPVSLSAFTIYCKAEKGCFATPARYQGYEYMLSTFTGAASWFALRKEVPAATRRKSVLDGCRTLRSGEYVPNVADVAYALTIFSLVYGQHLYEGVYARTTTQYMENCPVGVGMQDGHLSFLPEWEGMKCSNFGLAVARENLRR